MSDQRWNQLWDVVAALGVIVGTVIAGLLLAESLAWWAM